MRDDSTSVRNLVIGMLLVAAPFAIAYLLTRGKPYSEILTMSNYSGLTSRLNRGVTRCPSPTSRLTCKVAWQEVRKTLAHSL